MVGGSGKGKEMKSILVKSLYLVTVFGMTTSGVLRAAECLPSAPNGWTAPFTMVTLKNYATNQYASYVGGSSTVSNTNNFFSYSETYSSSGNPQLFSDRTAKVNCGGLFCPSQPFDINQADQLGVSVTKSSSIIIVPGGSGSPSYSATVTLQSWGNGRITFPLTCDATTGILYGAIGSDTHVAITTGTPVSPPK
jgi:hypothetical protein